MRYKDLRLGMRVQRGGGPNTLVRKGRALSPANRRVGVVAAEPVAITPKLISVELIWEGGSGPTELVRVSRLEPLPIEDQPTHLGGSWQPAANWPGLDFLPALKGGDSFS